MIDQSGEKLDFGFFYMQPGRNLCQAIFLNSLHCSHFRKGKWPDTQVKVDLHFSAKAVYLLSVNIIV